MQGSIYKEVLDKTLCFFKQNLTNARIGFSQRKKTANMYFDIFGERGYDSDFQIWFAQKMYLPDANCLQKFLSYADAEEPSWQPRNITSKEERCQVYNFWKANSTTSVFRSNGRNNVKIFVKNIGQQIIDIPDEEVKVDEDNEARRKAHRKVIATTYREMHQSYINSHSSSISLSAFIALKPFYVSCATIKEAEMCLCSSCMNPHSLYKAMKSVMSICKEYPYSLSEYLCKGFKCQRNQQTNFYHLDCILGNCGNGCAIADIAGELNDFTDTAKKNVPYYIFEKVPTYYFNKQGKKMCYERVARVDKKESVHSIGSSLQDLSKEYLVHRFFVKHDEYFWEKFLDETPYHTIWLDFSQNINLVEKNQVQSAHFSGKQQTLHNTVHIAPKRSARKYIYHLSDDTNHDSTMTFSVIEDIIEKHPEIVEKDILVIRSDNCGSQYKCRYTFAKMQELAMKYNITLAWFYSEPGHGKGTVDAMSSFGVKGPLRNEILRKDVWFENADQMVSFLKQKFANDKTKEHHHILDADNAAKRKKKRKELVIQSCRKFHLIAISSDGQIHRQLYAENLDGIFSENANPLEHDLIFEKDEELAIDNSTVFAQASGVGEDNMFELIWQNTYIALRSSRISIEPFILCCVVDKGIARERMADEHGHAILIGSKFIKVIYLSKAEQRAKHVRFVKTKQSPALIYVAEVAVTNVELDENLCMHIDEYNYVSEAVL